MNQIGILYHPQLEKAQELANKLKDLLDREGISTWQCPAWEEDKAKSQLAGSDLVFSIGGDGTMLHAAHVSAPFSVPVMGVNLGKVGFITEMGVDELLLRLPDIINAGGWIEERAMLEAQLQGRKFHALNEVVLRTTAVKLISVEVKIDGEVLAIYRADGIIVATATGSTAYALAAGGPVLHPQCREIILQPISCHLGLAQTLVLPSQSSVVARVVSNDNAILSLDGQLNLPISYEQNIIVKLSPYSSRFLRIGKPTYFYGSLYQKLRGK
ncbi:MAG: NAD(+)/NADH kinase [Chloroflexota bacterium]|nr:NAD(+)/NADH kinase [Chloroflexota bacterium]